LVFFYEIRRSTTALKRDGGFATQDAAKAAGREDAKKIKNSPQPDRLTTQTANRCSSLPTSKVLICLR
jgi:hypothetical protein